MKKFHSPNYETRKDGKTPRFLILHCTERTADYSHNRFMAATPAQENGRVSAHYMVLEDGTIHQYVDEAQRAWHAGISYWGGETDLNSASIGIELVNLGITEGYPPYAEPQIAATIELCQSILKRHPAITPFNVLGHSDIAPGRKVDPGPNFPWATFAEAGVGIMPPSSSSPLTGNIEEALTIIGYNPALPLEMRMEAFCTHYAPEGLGDAGFAAIHDKLWWLAHAKENFA
jgi:N-acetylmuramoyl-L-alanine amidase